MELAAFHAAVEVPPHQVLKRILAAFGYRRQMIDSETNALPAFVGVAILAQGISTFADLLSNDSGQPTRHSLPLESDCD